MTTRSPHISAGRSAAARLLEQTARLWAVKGSIEALRVRSAGSARVGDGGSGGCGRCWKQRLCAGRGHAGDGAGAAGRRRPYQLRRVPLLVLPEGELSGASRGSLELGPPRPHRRRSLPQAQREKEQGLTRFGRVSIPCAPGHGREQRVLLTPELLVQLQRHFVV